MCGRMTLHDEQAVLDLLEKHFEIEDISFHDLPRYNIAPKQMLWTIIYDGQRFRVGQISWGMMIASKDKSYFNINAKKESLETFRFFKDLYQHKRCLILLDGYYEWQDQGDFKQPFYVFDRLKKTMLGAALFNKDENGFHTTLITQEPIEALKHIHHRMPLLLTPHEGIQYLKEGVLPKTSEKLEISYHEVSTKVNQVKLDDATLIDAFDPFSVG